MRFIWILLFSFNILFGQNVPTVIKITQPYLNLPVAHDQERGKMTITDNNGLKREFVIRLSDDIVDYWVYTDVSDFIGKTLTLDFKEDRNGLKNIYNSSEIADSDDLYRERLRPQAHFSTQRGWINDPNGLVYYDGEYHLFYQHNPYEIHWENMHWGHAVSKDLLHWEELGDALFPDNLGTMFSGTIAVDENNSSGFQTGKEKTLIAAYTAHQSDKEVQCIAYSNDRGRTWTKYEGNPVIDSQKRWQSKHLRDPKIFYHQPSEKWVMVLFEKNGLSIYQSTDLKSWNYKSHVDGFWECPELFELPVDGNINNKKWVMYGASGTYMIGDFDGEKFTMISGKHQYYSGKQYASQTFNNIPKEDGRRIQIGWGQITSENMAFNQMMLFPTQLTLRNTKNGVRLFNQPISEIENLHIENHRWTNPTAEELNTRLSKIEGDAFHIKMKVEIIEGIRFILELDGNQIAHYSMNHNTLNDVFFEDDQIQSRTMDLEIIVDRTSVELFAQNGKFTKIDARKSPVNGKKGFYFNPHGSKLKIHEFEIAPLTSIWK